MGTERRITEQTEQILGVVAGDPCAEWWGAKIAAAAGLKSGSMYPALMRMERFGWLESRWEEIDPREEGRPRRRLYRLTGEGERVAREVIREAPIRRERRERRRGWGSTPGAQPA
jgi:PadR family transcriptional regulator PadR